MRSHFTLIRNAGLGGQQKASVFTPLGLSPFWPVRTLGCARWRSERAGRPALRQGRGVSRGSRGVSRESRPGSFWRSFGLCDSPETPRDASKAVYTNEPMVNVGGWDVGAVVFFGRT